MARTVRANIPFKLEGSMNTRELGGYPTTASGNTAGGQFLRSDGPTRFSEADKERLYDYGVRLVVDFRSEREATRSPCVLAGYKDIEYINPQLMDNLNSALAGGQSVPTPPTLHEMYTGFLDSEFARAKYLQVFKTILEKHMDNCVFFNCTMGKDRAGTFAMIILKIAGVPDNVIVTDYQASEVNLAPTMPGVLEGAKRAGRELTENFIETLSRSRPAEMQKTLEHFNKTYGTIDKWLELVGLNASEIAKLKGKILGSL